MINKMYIYFVSLYLQAKEAMLHCSQNIYLSLNTLISLIKSTFKSTHPAYLTIYVQAKVWSMTWHTFVVLYLLDRLLILSRCVLFTVNKKKKINIVLFLSKVEKISLVL